MKLKHGIFFMFKQCLKTFVFAMVFVLISDYLAFGEVRLKDVVLIKDQREIQLIGL